MTLSSLLKPSTKPMTLRATGAGVNTIDLLPPSQTGCLSLYISYNSISSLENISQFKSLKALLMDFNEISRIEDLEPLSTLKNLTVLHIEGNPVCDLPLWDFHLITLCPKVRVLNGQKTKDFLYTKSQIHHFLELESKFIQFIITAKYVIKVLKFKIMNPSLTYAIATKITQRTMFKDPDFQSNYANDLRLQCAKADVDGYFSMIRRKLLNQHQKINQLAKDAREQNKTHSILLDQIRLCSDFDEFIESMQDLQDSALQVVGLGTGPIIVVQPKQDNFLVSHRTLKFDKDSQSYFQSNSQKTSSIRDQVYPIENYNPKNTNDSFLSHEQAIAIEEEEELNEGPSDQTNKSNKTQNTNNNGNEAETEKELMANNANKNDNNDKNQTLNESSEIKASFLSESNSQIDGTLNTQSNNEQSSKLTNPVRSATNSVTDIQVPETALSESFAPNKKQQANKKVPYSEMFSEPPDTQETRMKAQKSKEEFISQHKNHTQEQNRNNELLSEGSNSLNSSTNNNQNLENEPTMDQNQEQRENGNQSLNDRNPNSQSQKPSQEYKDFQNPIEKNNELSQSEDSSSKRSQGQKQNQIDKETSEQQQSSKQEENESQLLNSDNLNMDSQKQNLNANDSIQSPQNQKQPANQNLNENNSFLDSQNENQTNYQNSNENNSFLDSTNENQTNYQNSNENNSFLDSTNENQTNYQNTNSDNSNKGSQIQNQPNNQNSDNIPPSINQGNNQNLNDNDDSSKGSQIQNQVNNQPPTANQPTEQPQEIDSYQNQSSNKVSQNQDMNENETNEIQNSSALSNKQTNQDEINNNQFQQQIQNQMNEIQSALLNEEEEEEIYEIQNQYNTAQQPTNLNRNIFEQQDMFKEEEEDENREFEFENQQQQEQREYQNFIKTTSNTNESNESAEQSNRQRELSIQFEVEIEEEEKEEFAEKKRKRSKRSKNKPVKIISDVDTDYAQSLSDTDTPGRPTANTNKKKEQLSQSEEQFIFEKSKSKSSFRSIDDNEMSSSVSNELKSILRYPNVTKTNNNEAETNGQKIPLSISNPNINEKDNGVIDRTLENPSSVYFDASSDKSSEFGDIRLPKVKTSLVPVDYMCKAFTIWKNRFRKRYKQPDKQFVLYIQLLEQLDNAKSTIKKEKKVQLRSSNKSETQRGDQLRQISLKQELKRKIEHQKDINRALQKRLNQYISENECLQGFLDSPFEKTFSAGFNPALSQSSQSSKTKSRKKNSLTAQYCAMLREKK